MSLVIQVSSSGFDAGNKASIVVNGDKIEVGENENGHLRGMHIVVLNGDNQKMVFGEAFDTYKSSESLEKWIVNFDMKQNFIVIAACKDEASMHLSEKVIKWFKELGSKNISELGYRYGFVFVGGTGTHKKEANEKISLDQSESVSLTQIFQINREIAALHVAKSIDFPSYKFSSTDIVLSNIDENKS